MKLSRVQMLLASTVMETVWLQSIAVAHGQSAKWTVATKCTPLPWLQLERVLRAWQRAAIRRLAPLAMASAHLPWTAQGSGKHVALLVSQQPIECGFSHRLHLAQERLVQRRQIARMAKAGAKNPLIAWVDGQSARQTAARSCSECRSGH